SGEPDDAPHFTSHGFCGAASEVLLAGDVNADGRDDLVCVNTATRAVRVDLSSASFLYDGITDISSTPAAATGCYRPQLGDFNGDGRADLLCLATVLSTTPTIELGVPSGTFTAPDFSVPACAQFRSV